MRTHVCTVIVGLLIISTVSVGGMNSTHDRIDEAAPLEESSSAASSPEYSQSEQGSRSPGSSLVFSKAPTPSPMARLRTSARQFRKLMSPKPCEYHRRQMCYHTRWAGKKARQAALGVPVFTAAGVVGGLAAPLCAIETIRNRDAVRTVQNVLNIGLKPAVGAAAGSVMSIFTAYDAARDSALAAHHAIIYPIAKCRDLVCGTPSLDKKERYRSKHSSLVANRHDYEQTIKESEKRTLRALTGHLPTMIPRPEKADYIHPMSFPDSDEENDR